MSAHPDDFNRDRDYGLTRGVQAYHELVSEKPEFRDKTVEEIARAALILAIASEERGDIVASVATRATIDAIEAQTIGIEINGR